MDKSDKKRQLYTHITDVGCVRELNEDSLFCDDSLCLVADGMGGHACGEVASQLAVEIIAKKYAETGSLTDAIQMAHERIIEAGQQGVGQAGMGTTVVAVTSSAKSYQMAWVGDSRGYLWDKRKQKLTQLTEDHSLIVRLIKSGLISVDEAKKHPQRHMITQCLGSIEIPKLTVDIVKADWKANQQILLCSDGLSDDVNEEEISQVLLQQISNDEKLAELVNKAKQVGGKDNISLILIDSPLVEDKNAWKKLKSLFM